MKFKSLTSDSTEAADRRLSTRLCPHPEDRIVQSVQSMRKAYRSCGRCQTHSLTTGVTSRCSAIDSGKDTCGLLPDEVASGPSETVNDRATLENKPESRASEPAHTARTTSRPADTATASAVQGWEYTEEELEEMQKLLQVNADWEKRSGKDDEGSHGQTI